MDPRAREIHYNTVDMLSRLKDCSLLDPIVSYKEDEEL
jgi:hypothetical protein